MKHEKITKCTKRMVLIKHLKLHGCVIKREGGGHTIWVNPRNGVSQAIPRHPVLRVQIPYKVCRNFDIPHVGNLDV